MQCIRTGNNQNSLDGIPAGGELLEMEPLHPDDFEALLAWVTAKEFREQALGKTLAEKVPVYYPGTGCRL